MSMTWLLTNIVAVFLLPPLNGLAMAALGVVLLGRRPRLGKGLVALGLAMLAALSLQPVADALIAPLELRHPALSLGDAAVPPVDAIVVLGGGRYRMAPEFGGEDDVKSASLERLRYAATVARRLGKPLLMTGGLPDGGSRSEAEVMRDALKRDFGVETKWIEGRSDDTRQNARYSAEILLPSGHKRIALVTSAFHMPRSVEAFQAAGFEVVPAATAFMSKRTPWTPLDFLPRADAMRLSSLALHEWIGIAWYRFRR